MKLSSFCLVFLCIFHVSTAAQDGNTDIGYRWRAGRFSPCSKTCGGIQRRRVICQGKTLRGIVFEARTELKCNRNSKPMKKRSCGFECLQYKWVAGPYDECNAACGPGSQSRFVECKQSNSSSEVTVSDQHCIDANNSPKPNASRSCHSECGGHHSMVDCR
ncbi:ADAMTS-like protein 4 isoform X2 [Corticium candelabrum]|uniref:ADAMTS-like protein 4 isoform X2 n=1 Tax=Corticium candelabrum TaxID=121492 RepID=UPI002E266837|nr:ADAMTS-like protein 4 isoform X2 [Corticium candelabrum]